MLYNSINISIERDGQYDFIQKYCLNNYYMFSKKKNMNILFPKLIINKIKKISLKKSDILLKILIIHYFLYSRKPYLTYVSSKQKSNGNIILKMSFSLKKILYLQMINKIDYIFSKYFFYSNIISIYIKYMFVKFFKVKKKNSFLFKILKI